MFIPAQGKARATKVREVMPDLSYAFLTSLTDGQLADLDEDP